MPDRDFHSEETREIMGTIPSWIVRWGITVLLVIIVGIGIGCYFIKYPETVKGTVVITTINPPSDLIVRYDGLISKITVNNGQEVKAGELIAVIANPADYSSVLEVERTLNEISQYLVSDYVLKAFFDNDFILGDLQSGYSDFRKQCLDYRYYLQQGVIQQKQTLISDQIEKYKSYYNQLETQLYIMGQELDIEERNFDRDSVLYNKGLISAVDFDNSYKNLLQKQNSLESFRGSMINTELTIIQNEQQIIDLATQFETEKAAYESSIIQAQQNLLSQIAQWKVQYIIESPIDGNVSLTNYWSKNQRVVVGERFASVIPDMELEVVGRMNIPSAGLGRVKDGQTVNVRLNSYPYMEFGLLKGVVRSVSAVPEKDAGYIAEVVFPDNLMTTYRKELPLIQQMDGTGEIITEDVRLIQRFVQPIRASFQR